MAGQCTALASDYRHRSLGICGWGTSCGAPAVTAGYLNGLRGSEIGCRDTNIKNEEEAKMQEINNGTAPSDALVLFGTTGDLAYKKFFPALYALVKQGFLIVPVVGVAFSPWSLEQVRERIAQAVS